MTFPLTHFRSSSCTASCSTVSLSRVLNVNRISKQRSVPTRSLWWWSRHGTWSSSSDESLEDRMQKHSKIMRHRYSRALRRRALWDRDNSPPLWALRGPSRWSGRYWGCKPLSTTEQMQARLKDENSSVLKHGVPWEHAQKDFESFKVAVDKAIERDAYGFLFGRRLQGPLSPSNSSWTSFTQIFDSQASRDKFESQPSPSNRAKRIKIETLDKTAVGKASEPSVFQQPEPVTKDSTKSVEDDYIYDPVSGRNVPKKLQHSPASTVASKPLFQTLFSEHGVEDQQRQPKKPNLENEVKATTFRRFENSRSHEYQQLRAATLGNSIDTTAQYGGKYEETPMTSGPANNRDRDEPFETDHSQPFVGTAYDLANGRCRGLTPARSKWLQAEGFSTTHSVDASTSYTSPSQSYGHRLQPSLDRLHSKCPETNKSFESKLQPAVDRMHKPRDPDLRPVRPAPLNVTKTPGKHSQSALGYIERGSSQDMREDLDLLRPSDIRANMKSARTTQKEIKEAKKETRDKLEADFERHGKEELRSEDSSVLPSTRLARMIVGSNLSLLANHIGKYPNGVVAKTVQSMENFRNHLAKYQKPLSPSSNQIDPVTTKQKSIHKTTATYQSSATTPHARTPDNPSEDVKVFEQQKKHLADALKTIRNRDANNRDTEKTQFIALAETLREVYQSYEEPKLQMDGGSLSAKLVSSAASSVESMHGMQNSLAIATVKPGVQRYPIIEHHTQVFEPKLAGLYDRVKAVKKNLLNVESSINDTRMQRESFVQQMTKQDKQSNHLSNEGDVMRNTSVIKPPHRRLTSDERQRLDAMRELNQRLKSDPALLEKPVLHVKSRESSQQEHNLAVEHTPQTSGQQEHLTLSANSSYLILTYNKLSGDVQTTQVDNLLGSYATKTEDANPITVMSKLNYPAAFVSRFTELEKAGYKLVNGGGDLLIFKQQELTERSQREIDVQGALKANEARVTELENRIAKEEAQNQPDSKHVTDLSPLPKSAATVLDEIPKPTPVPSSPSPPTSKLDHDDIEITKKSEDKNSSPASQIPSSPSDLNTQNNTLHKRKDRRSYKIRRQEQVFSGTIKPASQLSSSTNKHPSNSDTKPKQDFRNRVSGEPGVVKRFTQFVKNVVLTTVVLGGVAYAIGVVAEGMGAHNQVNQGLTNGHEASEPGPRKKIVMPIGQRPGIYSTESSRH